MAQLGARVRARYARARMVMVAPTVIRAMREQGSNAQHGAYDQEHAYLFSVLKHFVPPWENPQVD